MVTAAVKVCEKCGHPIPTLDVLSDLTKHQMKIFLALHKAGQAGLSLDRIIEIVYADDPSGGPTYATDSVRCAMWQMGAKLKIHSLRIACGRASVRRLQKIP